MYHIYAYKYEAIIIKNVINFHYIHDFPMRTAVSENIAIYSNCFGNFKLTLSFFYSNTGYCFSVKFDTLQLEAFKL